MHTILIIAGHLAHPFSLRPVIVSPRGSQGERNGMLQGYGWLPSRYYVQLLDGLNCRRKQLARPQCQQSPPSRLTDGCFATGSSQCLFKYHLFFFLPPSRLSPLLVWIPHLGPKSNSNHIDLSSCPTFSFSWFTYMHSHVRHNILLGHIDFHRRRLPWQLYRWHHHGASW